MKVGVVLMTVSCLWQCRAYDSVVLMTVSFFLNETLLETKMFLSKHITPT